MNKQERENFLLLLSDIVYEIFNTTINSEKIKHNITFLYQENSNKDSIGHECSFVDIQKFRITITEMCDISLLIRNESLNHVYPQYTRILTRSINNPNSIDDFIKALKQS